MEWVKRRVSVFNQEQPSYQEVAHVIFFRLRSDGVACYQMSRMSKASMADRISGGWIHQKFEEYRNEGYEKTIRMSIKEFDDHFEKLTKSLKGYEMEEF